MIDKVDEKVEKSDLKTINGESVLGEGDLRVGVKNVESVEALEKLDAQVGDIATIGSESLEVVSVGNLYTSTFDNFSKDWDKLTRINKIELGEPVKGEGVYAAVLLCKNGETAIDNTIQIASENGTLFIVHHYRDSDTSSVTTHISESKANELLKKDEYRLYFYYAYETLNAVEVADKIVKLIIDHSSADAYIKSDSWEKLAKEYVVSSEEGLNSLDVENGTIASVKEGGIVTKSLREIDPTLNGLASDSYVRVAGLSFGIPSAIPENVMYTLRFVEQDKKTQINVIAINGGMFWRLGNDSTNDHLLYLKESNENYEKTDGIVESAVAELNELLSSKDYRYWANFGSGTLSESSYDIIDTFVKRIEYTPDAYIKGETWEKLSKEYVVASEEELNSLDVPNGTIAKVAYETHSEIKPSSCLDSMSNWEAGTRITKVNLSNAPVDNVTAVLYAYEGSTLIGILGILYSNGEVICEEANAGTLSLDELNDALLVNEYKLVGANFIQLEDFDNTFRFYTEPITDVTDAYIKGETWTKLLKEKDAITNITDSLAEYVERYPLGNAYVLVDINHTSHVCIVDTIGGLEIDGVWHTYVEYNLGNKRYRRYYNAVNSFIFAFEEVISEAGDSTFVIDLTVEEIEDAISNNNGVIDYSLNRDLIINALSKNIPMVVKIGEHSEGYCLAQGELDGTDTLTITFSHSQYKYSLLIGDNDIEVDRRNVESFVTSTPLRIWYSDELTPAQKEDNVRAYNALMNKEAFDFELLYIEEGEDYYSINKEVVTGFTCHLDSQKVHISILVAATENGLMTEPLYLISDGTFEFEAPPL